MTSPHFSFLELETRAWRLRLSLQRRQPQIRICFLETVATPWSQTIWQLGASFENQGVLWCLWALRCQENLLNGHRTQTSPLPEVSEASAFGKVLAIWVAWPRGFIQDYSGVSFGFGHHFHALYLGTFFVADGIGDTPITVKIGYLFYENHW